MVFWELNYFSFIFKILEDIKNGAKKSIFRKIYYSLNYIKKKPKLRIRIGEQTNIIQLTSYFN